MIKIYLIKRTTTLIIRDVYPMLLVANKVDLVHLRKVTEEQGRELAHKLGIPYIETSAKDPPLNIDATFHEVFILLKLNLGLFKIFQKSDSNITTFKLNILQGL